MPKRIMVIDDDVQLCKLLRLYLTQGGFAVRVGNTAQDAMRLVENTPPDLLLLDIMLPQQDGFSFCRKLRQKSQMPIVLLSAKSDVQDKIKGLECGADDYITKPFDPGELLARLRAVLRRAEPKTVEELIDAKPLRLHNLEIHMRSHALWVQGKAITVARKELDLLYYLACHPNQVFTRNQLLEAVWGLGATGTPPRTVDVHIRRLREKLEGASPHWSLQTIWSVGYQLQLNAKGTANTKEALEYEI